MKKIKLYIYIFILLIASGTFIFSTNNIIKWKIDNNKISDNIKQINEITKIDNIEVEQDNNKIIYPDVSFDELLKVNKDTIGWIKVNNTNINYPFVQTNNNEYYLKHSFDKKYNNAGWAFMDYHNNIDDLSKNTVLYAHGRLDLTMFGSLKMILEPSWYNNSDNYYIPMSTVKSNYLWQVFSVYKIKTEDYYIKTAFSNDDNYLTFLNTIKNRSVYDFNIDLNKDDNVLTLSTCYNNTTKVVLHAKLVNTIQK